MSNLEENFNSGVLEDNRFTVDKLKDYSSEELFSSSNLEWIDWEEWKLKEENIKLLNTLDVQNQAQSLSCLAQSGALALAINNLNEEGQYRRMSARSIYPFRINITSGGMWVNDLGGLLTSRGALFESLLPSEGKGEDEMNKLDDYLPSYEKISNIYKADKYFWITLNIDSVANILNRNKPVILTVKFGNGEWSKEVPTIIEGNPAPYGHGIVALPKAFFMYEGKKSVLIQDSWGIKTGMKGRRIVTEDWFIERMKAAIWTEDLNNLAIINSTLEKPSFNFTGTLQVGNRNSEVAMLQRCLGYLKDDEGYLFPLGQEPTGYFGGITRQAVKRFQKMASIIQTGLVGSLTREALNNTFQ